MVKTQAPVTGDWSHSKKKNYGQKHIMPWYVHSPEELHFVNAPLRRVEMPFYPY